MQVKDLIINIIQQSEKFNICFFFLYSLKIRVSNTIIHHNFYTFAQPERKIQRSGNGTSLKQTACKS